MIIKLLAATLDRELDTLGKELQAYDNEAQIWVLREGISNSGGTLALHICGNLRHYIGAVLGKSGYIRDRPAEFSERDIARDALLEIVERTREELAQTFAAMDPEVPGRDYPQKVAGCIIQTGDWLQHLAVHLGYHLGQIDYHRRMISGRNQITGAISVARLYTARAE